MKTNKLNIAEILKNCPEGTILYSPLCGKCKLKYVENKEDDAYTIRVKVLNENSIIHDISFNSDGTYMNTINKGIYLGIGECLLFPSEENRDWSTFKGPKFDPRTLQPFDKVLVYCDFYGWICGVFSHSDDDKFIISSEIKYKRVIPYNNETKYLIGTKDKVPEFYRYWEN